MGDLPKGQVTLYKYMNQRKGPSDNHFRNTANYLPRPPASPDLNSFNCNIMRSYIPAPSLGLRSNSVSLVKLTLLKDNL